MLFDLVWGLLVFIKKHLIKQSVLCVGNFLSINLVLCSQRKKTVYGYFGLVITLFMAAVYRTELCTNLYC